MSAVIDALVRWAAFRPDAPALSGDDGLLSWRQLASEVEATAAMLDAALAGVPVERPIAVDLPNGPAWVIVDLALIRLGRTALPVPGFYTEAQCEAALADAGAAAILRPAPHAGEPVFAGRDELRLDRTGLPAAAVPAGTAKITYTSGSTGAPKGVCLSLAHMEAVAAGLVARIGADYAGRHVAVLPMGVLLENVAGLYPVILAGGHYDIPSAERLGLADPFRPDIARFASAVAQRQAASLILVPELLRGLLAALATSGLRLTALRLVAVGGARVSPQLLADAAALGVPVRQGYGLSECASVVALNTPADDRPGTVGKPLPHLSVSLADDGEILIDGPLTLGLVGAPRAAGPLATGDIGRLDDDGYLVIEGRKANTLITGFGRNIAPEWVESELLAEAAVGQALVAGEAQAGLVALLVPSSPMVGAAELAAAVAAANLRLPAYARIARWVRVPPFTADRGLLTGNGRPRRAAIQTLYADLIDPAHGGAAMPFFDRLRVETQAEQAALFTVPQIRAGLSGTISRATYIAYLTEAYHHVKHTVPLMQAARAGLQARGDAMLVEALDEYIAEETGHERWILKDIRNCGGNDEAVRTGTPRAATQAMVDAAYAFIRDVNPAGFFGMVYVLEGTSTLLATRGAGAVAEALGLGPECFSYLTSHGALDLDHMTFFEGLMNRLDSPADRDAVVAMAKRMFGLFADMFRSIPLTEELADVA
jgi:long-subunit acyl-CoA synthetase (AMP-forming)